MKQILFATIIIFLLLTSCNNFLTSEEREGVYLEYWGKSAEYKEMVQFRLVNNSNENVEYGGYSLKAPFYGYQIKNDTGWVRAKIWRCATGMGINELPVNSSAEFRTSKPDSLCVWRLSFNYTVKGSEDEITIYSTPIQNQL